MNDNIAIANVTKDFNTAAGSVRALEDINIDLAEGSFISLIGPSGCGKSTLLRLVGDLLSPTLGAISVFGKDAKEFRINREYGMVFQQPGLLDWRTVKANVELPLHVSGAPKRERAEKAEELLELVGLGDFANHRPGQLSGGMQQRAAIARALSFTPRLLLMDEPLGALDEMNREYLQHELLRIWRETKTTIVFVTHSVSEAVFLSNEVIVMSPRPGKVADRIPIDLPYPRTEETRTGEPFKEIEAKVRRALHAVMPQVAA